MSMDGVLPALPTRLQVEVTAACNLRCRMCLVRYREPVRRSQGTLSLKCFERILDEVPSVKEITLQGVGEPLLVPHLAAMVSLAASRGIATGFNTNGTLLSAERSKRLILAGLRWLCISVDGATPAVYQDVRDGARFERVVSNIRSLVEAKRGLAAEDLRLQVVFVAMRRNLAELPLLVHRVADWGIPSLRVQNLSHSFSDASSDASYEEIREYTHAEALWRDGDLSRVRAIFEEARMEAEAVGIELRLPELVPTSRTRPVGTAGCSWPWEAAYIAHDGAVQPCCMLMGSERGRLGHMNESSFGAIWQSPTYQDFRTALLGSDPPAVCRGCSEYSGVF
jgi:radical SAM protein with 4Fe4S-binding SPASM domain